MKSRRVEVRWAAASACQAIGVELLGLGCEADLLSLLDDADPDVRVVSLAAIEGLKQNPVAF